MILPDLTMNATKLKTNCFNTSKGFWLTNGGLN